MGTLYRDLQNLDAAIDAFHRALSVDANNVPALDNLGVALLDSGRIEDAISAYRSAFREALERDGRMCLCGVLGAEAGVLPPEVVQEIQSFFRRCIDDLTQRIGGQTKETQRRISTFVPTGTTDQISSISELLTATHPAVQFS